MCKVSVNDTAVEPNVHIKMSIDENEYKKQYQTTTTEWQASHIHDEMLRVKRVWLLSHGC